MSITKAHVMRVDPALATLADALRYRFGELRVEHLKLKNADGSITEQGEPIGAQAWRRGEVVARLSSLPDCEKEAKADRARYLVERAAMLADVKRRRRAVKR